MTAPSPPRRGPRGAAADTREAILREARSAFAAYGYAGTTLRHVAQAAGVDASLLSYYFGSKENLFAAATELPPSPREIVRAALAGPLDALGEALTRLLLCAWADADSRRAAHGVLQSLSERDDFAETALRYAHEHLLGPLAGALPEPDADYRAALAVSHLLGVALARHVAVTPLQPVDDERLVADIAPVVQRYLTGELPSATPGSIQAT